MSKLQEGLKLINEYFEETHGVKHPVINISIHDHLDSINNEDAEKIIKDASKILGLVSKNRISKDKSIAFWRAFDAYSLLEIAAFYPPEQFRCPLIEEVERR